MRIKKCFLLLVLTLFFSLNIWGQNVYYQTLGNKQGLSQSSAVAFWQDRIGRIWIGNDALNCYNGESVTVFRISEYLKGIEDSNIHALCGNDSILFFLAENTLIRFDLTSQSFSNTGIFSYSICYSGDYLYYVSRDSAFTAYNWKTKETESIVSLPSVRGSDFILEKEKDEFWIATPVGVYIVDVKEKKVTERLLQDKHIVVIYKDSHGVIWLATQDHQIYLYTPGRELITLKINGDMADFSQGFPNSIFCIEEDVKGAIWIGTLTGIYHLIRENDTVFSFQDQVLQESTIYALFSDRQGTIWIGSYYGDVRYYNPITDNFIYYETDESNSVRLHGAVIGQIERDKKGNMYFATEGSGINILRPGSSSFEHITVTNGLPQNKVRDIWYDQAYDRLFISTYMEGICYLDIKTKKIHRIRQDILQTIHQRIIENIYPYKGDLVLHTQNGLFRLNRHTLEIDWFFDEENLRERCSGIIRAIYIDNKNVMWVSSYRNGLFTIDLNTGKELRQYGDGISENSKIPSAVIKIAGDSKRGLYFVSLRSGILKYEASADSFFVFNEENHHLLSNICYNIAFSQSGKLVVTSNKGISLIEISSENVILSSHNIRISPTSPLTAFIGDCGMYVSPEENGLIYVGGLYGLFGFSEKNLPADQNDYSLFFSSLNVNNKSILPGSPLLKKSFYLTDKLVLPYNKNTLSINFASSNYLSSRITGYEYKLEGLDDLWTETNHKTLIYNSLRPGRYKLIVRERSNPLKVAELAIIVNPPFWATMPAIIIYILLGGFLLGWIIRFNKSKSMLQASLEMERREISRIEETNRNKMDFFVNISNEFRTPLTLILSQLDRLPKDLPLTVKNKIEKVKKQAGRLQDLITEMLDFRRMEQNKLRLRVTSHDMLTFLQGIYATFSDYAQEKQLNFRLNLSYEVVVLWFDQRQMQKVFYNILSFLFKVAAAKDSITLSLHKVTGFTKIHITLRGILDKENELNVLLDVINNSHPMTDLSLFPDGIIGVAFGKGIIQLHKGVISAEKEDEKLTIVITLSSGISLIDKENITEEFNHLDSPPTPLVLNELVEHDPFWKEKMQDDEEKSLRMVLIEEDHEMSILLTETFSMLYEVIAFREVETAYNFIVEKQPDIVLSEVSLSGISGVEMCSMLKSNIKTYHIPVILLSSQPSDQQNVESIRSGADYYFVKPFNIRILFLRCNYLVMSRQRLMCNGSDKPVDVVQIMPTNEKEQEFLTAANQVVEEYWEDHSFDTTVWYERLGIGRTRFFTDIKEITGMTPNDYLLYLKMNKASQLLDEKNKLTIAEVAYKLGFSNPAYFSKCFKKQFGITPQEFKRKN